MASSGVVNRVMTARVGEKSHTEESRAFLQERMALYGKSCFALAGGFLVLIVTLKISGPEGFAGALKPFHGVHLLMCLAFAMLWLVCRKSVLSASTLTFVDALITIVVGGSLAANVLLLPREPAAQFPMLLAFTHVSVARAVIIPSSALRTLVISALAAVPLVATTLILALITKHRVEEPGARAFLVTAGGSWCVAAVGIAALTSRVIYGLQKQVDEARRLGQYTIVEKIAEGGMGVVYRASHAMLRRPTAIKLLRPDDAGEASLARFEREVQLTSQLTHPNTIAIYDYGRTPEGVFYYAMEYLDGLNLEDLVERDGPQRPARVIHILAQVCGALAEAHGIGLIHRDIKPANIVLCDRGGAADVVKVVDFGLVKDIAAGDALTHAESLTGTPLYLSPEVIKSPLGIDARSDLYAVGAVGYYLLTGKHVFEGGSVLEVCSHHLQSTPVSPSDRLGHELPDDLESLILRCLEKDPAARPKDARALREALCACADASGWSDADAVAWWQSRPARTKQAADPLAATVTKELVSATMRVDIAHRAAG